MGVIIPFISVKNKNVAKYLTLEPLIIHLSNKEGSLLLNYGFLFNDLAEDFGYDDVKTFLDNLFYDLENCAISPDEDTRIKVHIYESVYLLSLLEFIRDKCEEDDFSLSVINKIYNLVLPSLDDYVDVLNEFQLDLSIKEKVDVLKSIYTLK